jgi:hypothetical protein
MLLMINLCQMSMNPNGKWPSLGKFSLVTIMYFSSTRLYIMLVSIFMFYLRNTCAPVWICEFLFDKNVDIIITSLAKHMILFFFSILKGHNAHGKWFPSLHFPSRGVFFSITGIICLDLANNKIRVVLMFFNNIFISFILDRSVLWSFFLVMCTMINLISK